MFKQFVFFTHVEALIDEEINKKDFLAKTNEVDEKNLLRMKIFPERDLRNVN